ncbi:MAG: hypothetical protein J6V50_02805, partial [Clostridia bacterium]|nr:hypothetical protein [Clostridia bacterium]
MDYEIITLDGAKLLYAAAIQNSKTVPTIYYAFDTTLKQEKYPRSALFDQLKEQLNIENDSHDIFLKTWVYADFEAPFHGEGVSPSRFEALFNNGFNLIYEDGETIHFVPFLNSASQSKRFVYGFIREELFSAMRKRLDLDFTLEDPTQSYTLQHISKLYGYRALYSSGATPVIRATDKGGEDFFNEENIIILHEMGAPCTVPVSYYTAKQESADSDTNKNEVAFKTPEVEREKVTISFFDGEGIISPKACKKINERLPKNAKAQSFQVRMPYFKGMLHTVDFHQFLRDNGVDGKITEAKVIDAFGEERDLFKANIIVTTTVFKMWGLLSDNLKKDKEKLRAIIRDYFEKIRLYNHGFYVGNTEAKLHNTETVSLSAQTLSTLKLSKEDLDGIVNDHKAKADAYSVENLLNREERERLYEESDRND